jgi:putative aldouronate transport system substrate-binding protein
VVLAAAAFSAGAAWAGGQNESAAAKAAPVELHWYQIGTPQPDVALVMEELSKYTREKIGVTVRMEQLDWGDYDKKMQVIVSSGEKFDIAFTCSWALNYREYAQRGAFADITDYMATEGQALREAIHPLYLKGAEVNGRLFAIPNNKDLAAKMTWTFNKRLLDKYSLDVAPIANLVGNESYRALEPYLKVVAPKEPDLGALTPAGVEGSLPYDWVLGWGIPVAVRADQKDGRVFNVYEDPLFKELVGISRDFAQKGYIKADYDPNENVSQTGKYFVSHRQAWPLEVVDPMWSRSEKDPVKSVWCTPARITTDSALGAMLAVSKTSEQPHAAFQFLSLLNTDPRVRNLVDSGIEGVHYVMENGRQKDLDAATARYNMPSFSLGNLLILNVFVDEPASKWQLMRDLNDSGVASPAFGFFANDANIKNQVSALANIKDEFNNPLIYGKVDPVEYLAKAQAKAKAAGIDAVIAEVQRQFDAWKKTAH